MGREGARPKFDKPTIDRALAFGKRKDAPAPVKQPSEKATEVKAEKPKRPPAISTEDVRVPKLVTISQAAEMLTVSRPTVYRLIKSGELRFVRIGGPTGPLRLYAQEVADYIAGETKTEWDRPPKRGGGSKKRK